MTKEEIYIIFVAGIDFGIKHGFFPSVSILDLHEKLTRKKTKSVKSVTYTVMIAGFNYGSNLRTEKPNEEYIKTIFENLIEGKPLESDDNSYYAIKEKIQEILTDEKETTT